MKVALAVWVTCFFLTYPWMGFLSGDKEWWDGLRTRERLGFGALNAAVAPVLVWVAIVAFVYLWDWALA